jgi:hypothetical protein
MLTVDPVYRITVDDALRHPYLAQYGDGGDCAACLVPFDFSFELAATSRDDYKVAVFSEMLTQRRRSF